MNFFLPLFTPNDFKQENVVYGFIDNKSYVHDLCMWMNGCESVGLG
jgi:hypothetical protein